MIYCIMLHNRCIEKSERNQSGQFYFPLWEALKSPLFMALQNGGLLNDDHKGGCVLYENRKQVESLLNK